MNITVKELAKKIVDHIKNDMAAMAGLGEFESMLKSTYGKNMMNAWELIVAQYIHDATKNQSYMAFFDGSAIPNPGKMKIGGYIKDAYMKTIYTYSDDGLKDGTNNEAEYLSLLHLIDLIIEKGIETVHIFGDSNLVVQQVNGVWKAKNSRMKKLRDQAIEKLKQIPTWSLAHVPREQNKEADNLTR